MIRESLTRRHLYTFSIEKRHAIVLSLNAAVNFMKVGERFKQKVNVGRWSNNYQLAVTKFKPSVRRGFLTISRKRFWNIILIGIFGTKENKLASRFDDQGAAIKFHAPKLKVSYDYFLEWGLLNIATVFLVHLKPLILGWISF